MGFPQILLLIVDIFSSFDPYNNLIYYFITPLFWGGRIFTIILFSNIYWSGFSSILVLVGYGFSLIYRQCRRTLLIHIKRFSGVLVCFFIILAYINIGGLVPYVFSLSSHMIFRLRFGLPFWNSLLLSSYLNSLRIFYAIFLPGGAPGWLNPFLVLVESVRIFVRPITISVRLVANIRAGHVVLCLIGIYCVCYFFLSWYLFLIILVVQISYIMFEFGIGGIQSYIFRLLMSLYADDHGA